MIHPVIELFKPVALLKSIQLHYNAALPKPFVIETDGVRLSQIVLNFVSNAIKFTDEGEICVTAEVLNADILSLADLSHMKVAAQYVRIAVEDTGCGVAPEDATALFNFFEQGSTNKRGGAGLGLAIAKQLVELMGGLIRCKPYAARLVEMSSGVVWRAHV